MSSAFILTICNKFFHLSFIFIFKKHFYLFVCLLAVIPVFLFSACGVVRRALHVPSWRQVALKTVSLFDREKRSQLVKELLALSTLHSPYIIDFLGAFYKEGITTIVLEYMNRNSLQK